MDPITTQQFQPVAQTLASADLALLQVPAFAPDGEQNIDAGQNHLREGVHALGVPEAPIPIPLRRQSQEAFVQADVIQETTFKKHFSHSKQAAIQQAQVHYQFPEDSTKNLTKDLTICVYGSSISGKNQDHALQGFLYDVTAIYQETVDRYRKEAFDANIKAFLKSKNKSKAKAKVSGSDVLSQLNSQFVAQNVPVKGCEWGLTKEKDVFLNVSVTCDKLGFSPTHHNSPKKGGPKDFILFFDKNKAKKGNFVPQELSGDDVLEFHILYQNQRAQLTHVKGTKYKGLSTSNSSKQTRRNDRDRKYSGAFEPDTD